MQFDEFTMSKTVSGDSSPAHVAIIMDGNGRWATARNLPRIAGHREGIGSVRCAIQAALRFGIPWLTLHAFSSENWRRPASEVSDLTTLLRRFLQTELAALSAQGVRLRIIGERANFDVDIQRQLLAAERQSANNSSLNLNVALSYGSRGEIVRAARIVAQAALAGEINPADLTEDDFSSFLFTAGMPEPDLVIRTSGEQRLSNFLLWQSAYAEFIFLDVLWPDFKVAHFENALRTYSMRERRFGVRPG
jgi:undecaprenyl diphosphate synthase